MERNIEFPNTMDLAQKLPPLTPCGDELKIHNGSIKFPNTIGLVHKVPHLVMS
jgi:hypothetical protein